MQPSRWESDDPVFKRSGGSFARWNAGGRWKSTTVNNVKTDAHQILFVPKEGSLVADDGELMTGRHDL
jgi:hypothetical protein